MDSKFLSSLIQAQTSIINGLNEQAVVLFSTLISQNSKNYDLFVQRALALLNVNNIESAIKDCESAIGIDASRPEAYWRRGTCHFQLAAFALAREDLQKALTSAMDAGDQGLCSQITISLKKLDAESKNAKFKEVVVPAEPIKPQPIAEANKTRVPLAGKIGYRWFQTNNKVGIEIKFKLENKDLLKTVFESKHAEIAFPIEPGRDYGLSLDLFDEIVPEGSVINVTLSHIEILMEKKNKSHNWAALESAETLNEKVAEDSGSKNEPLAQTKPVEQPSYPSSSKVKRDWGKIDKEIESEIKKDGGEDPLNSFFKQLYDHSNEETRRAMIKSFQTSGGTVLSTNWDEVKDKDYENKDRPEPPKGQEWKKWEKAFEKRSREAALPDSLSRTQGEKEQMTTMTESDLNSTFLTEEDSVYDLNALEDKVASKKRGQEDFLSDLFNAKGKSTIATEEDLKSYLSENYKNIIKISSEVSSIHDTFSEIKMKLESINKAIVNMNKENLQTITSTKRKDSNNQSSDEETNIESEMDAYFEKQQQRRKTAELNASEAAEKLNLFLKRDETEEQINEMLDNLDLNTYEKNYVECLKTYKLLVEMKRSPKFQTFLKDYEIRRALEANYNTLTESLINDIISENTHYSTEQLVETLIDIGQLDRAVNAILELRSRKIADLLRKEFEYLTSADSDFIEKVTTKFLENCLEIYTNFQDTFKAALSKNEALSSKFSSWLLNEAQVFYESIKTIIFSFPELDDIFDALRTLIVTLSNFESKGLTLGFVIQRICSQDFGKKLEELFVIYGEKLTLLQDADDWTIYKTVFIRDIDYFEEELSNEHMQEVTFDAESRKGMRKLIEELKIDSELMYETLFFDSGLKGSKFVILFWNIMFYTMDAILKYMNLEIYPVFSCYIACILEKKLLDFFEDFFESIHLTIQNSYALAENQLLGLLANLYTCYYLSTSLIKYLEVKLEKIGFKQNKRWRDIQRKIYKSLEYAANEYFKLKILNNFPNLFTLEGALYQEKRKINTIQEIKSPSKLFLMILNRIADIRDSFLMILLPGLANFLVNRLHYHANGKKAEFEFIIGKDLLHNSDFKLNNQPIFSNRDCLKIHQFTREGMLQFIFDINVLGYAASLFLPKDLHVDTDFFLGRVLHVFCKEVKGNILAEFIYKKEHFVQALESYFKSGQFEKERKSILAESQEDKNTVERGRRRFQTLTKAAVISWH